MTPRLSFLALSASLAVVSVSSFRVGNPTHSASRVTSGPTTTTTTTRTDSFLQMSDDFSNFANMDDDDDLLFGKEIDKKDYAGENDSDELKAEVGSSLVAPEIEMGQDVEPIWIEQGMQLELTEENVLGVLAACREEIGTMFGYSAENRGVGITGGVDYVEMDGPTVVLSLKGRFWHQRPTVLSRVGAYIIGRIPEVIDVIIDDEYQLTDEANNAAA